MAKSGNQKLKLLYLLKILEEESDEQHPMEARRLMEALARHGIRAERKAIYDDIEALQQFGYDIVVRRGRSNQYYLGERAFQIPELKLLVDVAQSARFITAKKSRELIAKLGKLASRHQAQQLQRQVLVQGRVKTMNESIYYTVDLLQAAIAQNRKVLCRYSEWVLDPAAPRRFSRRWRHGGREYSISPWTLIWEDENYYLAAFDSEAGILKHYRVDKLDRLRISPQEREGRQAFEALDMAGYTKRTFGMFGGEETEVELRFSGRLIGVVVDRFGKDIYIRPHPDGSFTLRAKVVVSPQFLAWVLGFGDEVQILSPADVARRLCALVESVRALYGGPPASP